MTEYAKQIDRRVEKLSEEFKPTKPSERGVKNPTKAVQKAQKIANVTLGHLVSGMRTRTEQGTGVKVVPGVETSSTPLQDTRAIAEAERKAEEEANK